MPQGTYFSDRNVQVDNSQVIVLGRSYNLADIHAANITFRIPAISWFGWGFCTSAWLAGVALLVYEALLISDHISPPFWALQPMLLVFVGLQFTGLLIIALGYARRGYGVFVRLEGTFGQEEVLHSNGSLYAWRVVRAIRKAIRSRDAVPA